MQPLQQPSATPLQQREWRRSAQRCVRLALTAVKDARCSFSAASAAGDKALAELSDAILTQVYLPKMVMGALQPVEGLKEAAARKLGIQQQQLLHTLRATCQQAQAAAQAAEGALQEVQAVVDPQQTWQATSPVFSCITAPRAAQLLSDVATMLQREVITKRGVYTLMHSVVAAHNPGLQLPEPKALTGEAMDAETNSTLSTALLHAEAGPQAGAAVGQVSARALEPQHWSEAELQGRLTTWLSCWLLNPHTDDGRVDEVLGALSEDMAGF
mmetsp:Transcript_13928/g.30090  ORF Transcript_13928/g.30090 Transcript_13928/m.30090 type:complete len:271 (+) Transcript_13928:817-1629(+)